MYGLAYESLPCQQASLTCSDVFPRCDASTPLNMGDCQNYGPFLGPYYNTGPNTEPNLGDPKRDHNFDNYPYIINGGSFGVPQQCGHGY